MPTLNWIGKEAAVKHHKEVPSRLLEPVPELSCGDQTARPESPAASLRRAGEMHLHRSSCNTGNLEITVKNMDDLERVKPYLIKSYEAS